MINLLIRLILLGFTKTRQSDLFKYLCF